MRRYINILFIAVTLAIVGCSKTSIIDVYVAETIKFNAFIDRSTTRGEVTTLSNVSTLSLDAYLSGSETWENRVSPQRYINDATLTIEDGSISCDVLAKWPDKNGNLSFFSYAPKSCSTISIVDPIGSEDVKLEFTAEDQPSDQSDIIFAVSKDLNNDNSGDGVSLTYDHILTKVGFSARTRFDYETPVVLNSIKIQYGDKIRNKGFYTFDDIEGIWSWSLEDSFHPDVVSEELVLDPAGIALSSDPIAISAEDKYLMLIPQKVEGLTAIIEYTNGYGEDLTASTVIPTCTLFEGRQYTYCLSVFTDELVFEPAIEDPWGDGDDLNITFEIWTEEQLASIGRSEKYPLNANYILMADLDIKNNYEGTWSPIEDYTGMFDGNNKSISNTTDVIFSTINSGGVKDLTVVAPSFTRNDATAGALVGTLVSGKIENCGVVGGSIESNVILGGVVGLATDSTISGCYNSCALSSSSVIGGIVGELRGENNKIMGCYNSAQISCNNPDQTTHHIGGIVGSLASGEVISCYNTGIIHIDDRDNSAISSIVGHKGAGVTTTSCYYQIGAACGVDGESFRELSELNGAVETMNGSIDDNGGTSSFTVVGESNIPKLHDEATATYGKVVEDTEYPIFGSVDMYNSITEHGASFDSYRMMVNMLYTSRVAKGVGTVATPFTSTFNGDNKQITGLQIVSDAAAIPQGLFSYAREGAAIKDLSLSNITVNSAYVAGVLVGDSAGTVVSNCLVEESSIAGASYVGGCVGQQVGGSITSCNIASSTVSGSDYVGGVVGHLSQGAIASCESAVNVSATASVSFAGGVVGLLNNSSTLDACSNISGSVLSSGGGYVGGIAGRNNVSTITNSEVVSGVSVKGVQSVGGISGDVVSGDISNSKSAATVEATTDCAGGISGYIHYSPSMVEGCEVTGGSVKAGGAYAGGVTGVISSGSMKECEVSNVAISGVHSVGGLFGASQVTEGVPTALKCSVSGATVNSSDKFAGGAAGQINAGKVIECTISATVSGQSFVGGIVGSFYNGGVIDACTSSSNVTGDLTTVATGVGQCIGGVAGQTVNATITGSSMTGGEVKGQTHVGGISGYSGASEDYSTPTLIENCSLVAGKVSGTTNVGGVLGFYSAGEIKGSDMNGGEVSGNEFVGGVLGSTVVNTTLSGCNMNGGSVSGQTNIGGVFGGVSPHVSGTMTISHCDATGGSVSGTSKVGGIVGSDDNTTLAIEYCDSRANVSATAGNVGGIVGQAVVKGSTIEYCTYGTGTVSGVSKCGGIVGQYQEALTQYCKVLYGVVTGTKYVGGIAGNVEYGARLWCCSNNAHVKCPASGGSCIGGVAGLAAYYSKSGDNTVAAIQGCCNTGYVEAPTANAVGGILGRGGAGAENPVYVRACYNACYKFNGSVYGNSKVGGIAGLDNKGGLHMHACYNYSPIFVTNSVNKERGGYILGSKAAGNGYTINCCYMHIYYNGNEYGNAAGGFADDVDLGTHTATSIQGYNDYVGSLNATMASMLPDSPEVQYEVGDPLPTLVWERTVTW